MSNPSTADGSWQADQVSKQGFNTQPPLNPTLAPHVMAGLDPAIGYPHQIANDAIPVSNHPMEMAGSSPAMTLVGPLRVVRQQLGRLI